MPSSWPRAAGTGSCTSSIFTNQSTARRRQEVRAGDPRREIPERWLSFEPLEFIPELQMVLVVFPYDRRLPQLSRVMNGATRVLEPLLLARLGPGRWQATDATIEPTR